MQKKVDCHLQLIEKQDKLDLDTRDKGKCISFFELENAKVRPHFAGQKKDNGKVKVGPHYLAGLDQVKPNSRSGPSIPIAQLTTQIVRDVDVALGPSRPVQTMLTAIDEPLGGTSKLIQTDHQWTEPSLTFYPNLREIFFMILLVATLERDNTNWMIEAGNHLEVIFKQEAYLSNEPSHDKVLETAMAAKNEQSQSTISCSNSFEGVKSMVTMVAPQEELDEEGEMAIPIIQEYNMQLVYRELEKDVVQKEQSNPYYFYTTMSSIDRFAIGLGFLES